MGPGWGYTWRGGTAPHPGSLFNGRSVRLARAAAPVKGTSSPLASRDRRSDRPPAAEGVRGERTAVGDMGRRPSHVGQVTGLLLIEAAPGICREPESHPVRTHVRTRNP